MNFDLLNKKLSEYIISSNNEIEKQELNERHEQELFYASYTKDKILAMDEA